MRALLPAIATAAAMVVAGAVLGLLVAGRLGTRVAAEPTPRPSLGVALATPRPSARPTALPSPSGTPRPSAKPTPTPRPTALPTPGPAGPDGVRPPLPALEIQGADPAVIAAFGAAVEGLADLRSYRFTAGVGGRSFLDLSQSGGINIGARGSITQARLRSVDALVAYQMVEFDNSAAITSTQQAILIGDEGWAIRPGRAPEPFDLGSPARKFVDLVQPAQIAARVLLPFAAGFERVGAERHGGIAATHYRATAAGRAAYAAVTKLRGRWTADVWIADQPGVLIELEIKVGGAGDDGFLATIEVTDVNDPTILIRRPG
jgi:hypothetical protein